MFDQSTKTVVVRPGSVWAKIADGNSVLLGGIVRVDGTVPAFVRVCAIRVSMPRELPSTSILLSSRSVLSCRTSNVSFHRHPFVLNATLQIFGKCMVCRTVCNGRIGFGGTIQIVARLTFNLNAATGLVTLVGKTESIQVGLSGVAFAAGYARPRPTRSWLKICRF